MSVVNAVVGALDDTSFKVKAKISGGTARLKVADNEALTGGVFGSFGTVSNNVATMSITGLAPDLQYYWAVEVGGVLDLGMAGRARTTKPVGDPYSYSVALYACAGSQPEFPGTTGLAPDRISDSVAFNRIMDRAPNLAVCMGDLAYYDFGSGVHVANPVTVSTYRDMYDAVWNTRQGLLQRLVPWVYTWSDHDYGPNDSDGSNPNKALAAQVYRERVPSYPLVEPSGSIYHSFQWGRVFWIVTDGRYNRDTPADPVPRTYLGAAQKAWLLNLIETKATDPSVAALVLVCEQPMNSGGGTSWGTAPAERTEIRTALADNNWLGRCCVVAGDQHQLGFDSGTNNAGIPVYTTCAIDSGTNGTSLNYDLGTRGGRQQYGLLRVQDEGWRVTVTTQGWGP